LTFWTNGVERPLRAKTLGYDLLFFVEEGKMERDFHSGLNNAERTVPDDDLTAGERMSELPLHPQVSAAEPADAGAARAELIPLEHPVPPKSQDQSSIHALEQFAAFIAAMKEQDYGDWMRRANVYWEQLRLNLLGSSNERDYIERELGGLKKIIQYTPNWKVLETQRAVIDKVLEMRRHFGGGEEINIHDLDISTSAQTPITDLH
jgi:hypothetical protein